MTPETDARNTERHPTVQSVDAVVIGTGISGLFTALKLAEHNGRVCLLTKTRLDECSSRYAQGGIAAVLPTNAGDSLESHIQDTLVAGAGLCDEAVVRSILAEGYEAILDLIDHGVDFDRDSAGELALGREAAHSVNRILHAAGDATGRSVEECLIRRVHDHPRIQVLENAFVTDLLINETRVAGCKVLLPDQQYPMNIRAHHTVIATGGVGQLYRFTTNPAISTGDGLALASRAGAVLKDMAFMQFHPTGFFINGQTHFLISEALRGEGAVLRNAEGERFAHRMHADAELAPRDVVTRAIFQEMRDSKTDHVFLDITHHSPEYLESRFPTIVAHCRSFGVDPATQWIPVAPAAHYMMGGIAVDAHGQSVVPSLFVVGESAHTGLHGANRLASNSLLECVVLARRVSALIQKSIPLALPDEEPESAMQPLDLTESFHPGNPDEQAVIQQTRDMLRDVMWLHVGIVRTVTGLKQAQLTLGEVLDRIGKHQWQHVAPEGMELLNMAQVARAMATDALQRPRSVGAHFCLDDSQTPATAGSAGSR
ncbi:MAG: L-aspartate oxidase [Candidatus Melainabacteria bacterium]